jgi:hypothetical protein
VPARPSNLGGEEILNVVNQSIREIQIRIDGLTKMIPVHRIVAGSSSLNLGTIDAGASVERTIQVSGAKQSGSASASPQLEPGAGLTWSAYITQNGAVTVRVSNPTGSPITANIVKWNASVTQ